MGLNDKSKQPVIRSSAEAYEIVGLIPGEKLERSVDPDGPDAEDVIAASKAKQDDKTAKTAGRKPGSGRKSNAQKEAEALAAKVNQKLEDAFAQLVIVATTGIGLLFDDRKWVAQPQESVAISAALMSYLDIKYPDWRQGSPEAILYLTLIGYVGPRFAQVERQPFPSNPMKSWATNLWRRLTGKGKKSTTTVEKTDQNE